MSDPGAQRLALYGASGHGRVVADLVGRLETFELAGFLDDERSEVFLGLPILGGSEALEALSSLGIQHLTIAIGDNATRCRLAKAAEEAGLELATLIHPSAVVAADATIGPGTVVMARAVIQSGARIGRNVIVNTGASVDHECILADGSALAPGVTLGGRVSVGTRTWVGIGATVRDGVAIGADSLIGAGAVVVEDLPGDVVAYGVPARVQRSH